MYVCMYVCMYVWLTEWMHELTEWENKISLEIVVCPKKGTFKGGVGQSKT